jgi:DNA adenine methylase
MPGMNAPFPWFGGKRKVATEVWSRFGAVDNYVEPFFGSGAVLLGRPSPFAGNETINDADGYVSNFWRAIKLAPDEVAACADNPVNENDLHARHTWLLAQRDSLVPRLEGDPDFFDAKIAGWWVWGVSCWIGSCFCSGRGPWQVVDGKLVHLGNNGRGVALREWFRELSARLSRVRVCSGDWSRVCGPSVTFKHGLTAVFLDPPYADTAERAEDLYRVDCTKIAHAVREWAIENGKRKDMRIALCGYEGEHQMPPDWAVYSWNAGQGFGAQANDRTLNGNRERIWYSPACLTAKQPDLFSGVGA